MQDPKITINEKDKTITIVMGLEPKPELSKSQKSLTIASTRGNFKSDVKYKDELITVGVNVYIRNKNFGA